MIRDYKNLDVIARTYIENIQQSEQQQTSVGNSNANAYGGALQQQRRSSTGPLWKIGLSDFIEICPKITGSRWRLPNCDVHDGWVTLFEEPQYGSSAKLSRLLRERIKAGVEQEALEKMGEITMDLAVRLAEPVGMVRNLMANKATEAIALVGADENDWPPCMRNAVAELANGVNLNHFGRLFLASMAATLALPKESCVAFFRGAPDFSESTTSYQVDHVYQHAYTPSGCGKLKINHNCPVLPGDDRLCDQPWLDHPLKYIRATQRWKAKNKQAEAQAAALVTQDTGAKTSGDDSPK